MNEMRNASTSAGYQYNGKSPEMSPLVMAFIKEFIGERQLKAFGYVRILEYGSGTSTIWLGKTFPEDNIFSVEGDEAWYEYVGESINKERLDNVTLFFAKQTEKYGHGEEFNPAYANGPLEFGPFDLIINDGGAREEVWDTIKDRLDDILNVGGLYLRHDYEKYICDIWRGNDLDGGKIQNAYEKFCAENENYSLITIPGCQAKWGFMCEAGGVWRRK